MSDKKKKKNGGYPAGEETERKLSPQHKTEEKKGVPPEETPDVKPENAPDEVREEKAIRIPDVRKRERAEAEDDEESRERARRRSERKNRERAEAEDDEESRERTRRRNARIRRERAERERKLGKQQAMILAVMLLAIFLVVWLYLLSPATRIKPVKTEPDTETEATEETIVKEPGVWTLQEGGYRFVDQTGNPVVDRKLQLADGMTLTMDKDGVLQEGSFTVTGGTYTSEARGWIRVNDGWLSFHGKWKTDGTAATEAGWVQENGIRYYRGADGKPGEYVVIKDSTEIVVPEGENPGAGVYIMNPDTRYSLRGPGAKDAGRIMITDAEGNPITETMICDLAKNVFYLDQNGMLSGGTVEQGKKLYCFLDDGSLCKGEQWIERDGGKFHVREDGTLSRQELLKTENGTFYFGEDGKMVTGFCTIDGKLRYFEEDGKMREESGWMDLGDKRYYINDRSEVLAGGIRELEGKQYAFDSSGALRKGVIHNGLDSFYYAGEDGAFLKDSDFTLEDGRTFYADPDGIVNIGSMYRKAQNYSSPTPYLILCNLATQKTAVFKGEKGNWRMLREMIVSTGAPINPTPKGEYNTTVHTEHFNSYGVRAWYATGFIGGKYLFHSSPYEIDSEPRVCTDDRLGVAASHGCVRMKLEDAKWMYDLLPLRTKVVIYEEKETTE